MRVKDAVGRFGEQIAATALSDAGLTIIDRNWRCREGELDLVARDAGDLVFVEVKTRSSTRYGSPAESIGPVKIARIRRLALHWLAAHRDDCFWDAIRFDVVSVLRRRDAPPAVTHIRRAF